MNVKKGIFRVIVVLSILSGFFTLVYIWRIVYYTERDELIMQKNALINAKGNELELNYLTQKLKNLVETHKNKGFPIKSEEEVAIERRIKDLSPSRRMPKPLVSVKDIQDYFDEQKMVKVYIPYDVRHSKELDELEAQKITFWHIIKHKPLLVLLPIPYFLAGFLSIWLFYFTISYILKRINMMDQRQLIKSSVALVCSLTILIIGIFIVLDNTSRFHSFDWLEVIFGVLLLSLGVIGIIIFGIYTVKRVLKL